MIQFLPIALKFFGLAGVNRRGWGLIGGVVLLLFSLTAIPAIKTKLPWIGTESRLARAEERNGLLQKQTDELSAGLNSCLSTVEDNRGTWNELQAQLEADRDHYQALAANSARAAEQYRAAEEQQRGRSRQLQRELTDALRDNSDWAALPIPGAVLDCLRRIEAGSGSCDPVRDDRAAGPSPDPSRP